MSKVNASFSYCLGLLLSLVVTEVLDVYVSLSVCVCVCVTEVHQTKPISW